MSHIVSLPAFLSRFKCIGAECEDPCCTGWNMQVDTLTRRRYEACGLTGSVTGEGEATVMKRDPKTGSCVKFQGGLCSIQREFGEQYLGDACYFYPRTTRSLGDVVTMTATLSCPEIARLALFEANPFEERSAQVDRLPERLRDHLPNGLTSEQAAAESLSRITPTVWPDAVPFHLQHADASLAPPEPRATDAVYLLQALCGLVAGEQQKVGGLGPNPMILLAN